MKNKIIDYLFEEEECNSTAYYLIYSLIMILPVVSIIICELIKRG